MNKNGQRVKAGFLPGAKASSAERPPLRRDPRFVSAAKNVDPPQAGFSSTGTRLLLVIVMTILLASATFMRNRVWQDSVCLWEDVIAKSPSKVRPHYQLGFLYDKNERIDKAMQEYQTALRLGPDPLSDRAHNNLGNIYGKQGRFEEAIREFQAILAFSPNDAAAHTNLGIIYAKQGRMDEALREFQAAIQSNPDDAAAHYAFGNAYQQRGLLDEAMREYHAALMLKLDYAEAHNNLGLLYGEQGRFAEAIQEFHAAIKSQPESAESYNNLGIVFAKQGRYDEAISAFQQALQRGAGHCAREVLAQVLDPFVVAFNGNHQNRPASGRKHQNTENTLGVYFLICVFARQMDLAGKAGGWLGGGGARRHGRVPGRTHRTGREGRADGVPEAGRGARARSEGRHVRRGEEHDRRRRVQGPAPQLHG